MEEIILTLGGVSQAVCWLASGVLVLLWAWPFFGRLPQPSFLGPAPCPRWEEYPDPLGLPAWRYKFIARRRLGWFGRWLVWVEEMPPCPALPRGLKAGRTLPRLAGSYPTWEDAKEEAAFWAAENQERLAAGGG